MPRPRKGPRLYLRRGRTDSASGQRLADIWFIRDGAYSRSTGFLQEELAEAEQALAAYIAQKHRRAPALAVQRRDPSLVLVAEVIELYALERAATLADPVSARGRLAALLEFWSDKRLVDVNRSNCNAYVAKRLTDPVRAFKDKAQARRVTESAARRELDDLSAAIGYWDDEHRLFRRPRVVKPPIRESARDALSRSEAAALLKAAMGWRRTAAGWTRLGRSAQANRAHLRRFILLGLYTGTRPGVLPKLVWSESDTHPWIDLERGWIFRRGRAEPERPHKRRPLARLPRRLLVHLRRWRRLDEAANAAREANGLKRLETVLHHGGEPLAGRVRKSYASAVADAGLRPEITPHWHRHTAATWLMESDTALPRAAQYLGMTVATLEKHYGHHRPDFQNDVAEALGRGGRRR